MFTRQIAIILLVAITNMVVGCTTMVNCSHDKFMKKPDQKIYGVNFPVRIHAVRSVDGVEYPLANKDCFYDIKSRTVYRVTDSAENIDLDQHEVASIEYLEKRGSDTVLVESDPQLFHGRMANMSTARIAGRTTPISRISFDYGFYYEKTGLIRGFVANRPVFQEKAENVLSLRVKRISYTKNAILVAAIAGYIVAAILWKEANSDW